MLNFCCKFLFYASLFYAAFGANLSNASSIKELKRKKFTYSSDDTLSLLAISSDRYPAWLWHNFRKVDLTSQTFEGDYVSISNVLKDPKKNKYKFEKRFAVGEIEEGTYALVLSSSTKKSGQRISHAWLCLADKAPVYEFRSGEISLFSAMLPHASRSRGFFATSAKPSKDIILHEAGLLFDNYEKVDAPLKYLEPIAYINFNNEANTDVADSNNCPRPDSFSLEAKIEQNSCKRYD